MKKALLKTVICTGVIMATLSCSKSDDNNTGGDVAVKTNSSEVALTTMNINERPNSENLVKLNQGTSEVYYTIPAQDEDTLLHIADIKVSVDGGPSASLMDKATVMEGSKASQSLGAGERAYLRNHTAYKLRIYAFSSYNSKNVTVDVIAVRTQASDQDWKRRISLVRHCADAADKSKQYNVVFSNGIGGTHLILQKGAYSTSQDINLGINRKDMYGSDKPTICGKSVDMVLLS